MANYAAIIAGTGSYLPQKRLTNDDLSKMVETNDEWIVQRTGIRERRLAAESETTASLATHAARQALEAAHVAPADLDLIICATCTPEMAFPSTGCYVGAALSASGVPAFDLSAACSGFIYALATGASFVEAGAYKNVLVIGAETLSRVVDFTDRGSCILFGDGAGAVLLQQGARGNRGLLYHTLHADGAGADAMQCGPGSRRPVNAQLLEDRGQYIKLRGREVYKFAVMKFEELIRDAMQKCDISEQELKLIIPHQVNQRIIDSAMERLGLPADKAFVNIDRYGNTSAASIPIALDEAVRSGRVKQGDAVVFVAFGAGLTWANAVARM